MVRRESIIQGYLVVMAELAEARVAAIFQPRNDRQELVAQVRLDQPAIDAVELSWKGRRSELEARGLLRFGTALVQQLRAGRATAGLLYLDRTQEGFPNGAQRQIHEQLTDLLAHGELAAIGPSIAQLDPEQTMREQIILALSRCAGNVAQAARLLGISRQTLYERINRFGISPAKFRLR